MLQPSKGFLASLESLDPLLRVRFGEYVQQWVVERKAFIPYDEIGYLKRRYERLREWIKDSTRLSHEQEKKTFIGVAEEYASARTGHRVVLFVKDLNREVYDSLCAGDISAYGGYSRYADELEKQEQRAQESRERASQALSDDISGETFDVLKFLWRHRETELLQGERDLGRMLHGKRGKKLDMPVASKPTPPKKAPVIEVVSA